MERRLTEIYQQAQSELTKKWNDYMKRGEKRLSVLLQAGDMQAYQDALQNYTLRNQWYHDMVAQTTRQLANVNQTALDYVNGKMPTVYAWNYNQAEDVAIQMGVRFDIVNEDVVRRLITDADIRTPYMHLQKFLDIPKDMRWNTKKLNASVLQGILQGESMDKIADRILPVVGYNQKAAIRNARTMVTGAENHGRQDSYRRLSDEGIVMNKVWMATPDGRTRDWHIDMDGQEVGINEAFIDGLGNELEYPGDPSGAPETVYNCRCTMVTHVIGFIRSDGSISKVGYEEIPTLHDQQMDAEKARREQ